MHAEPEIQLIRGRPPSLVMLQRRQRVVDAFAAAFAAKGYHGVGMREIADHLGLNVGTLYHYVKSKDDALLSVCLAGQARALSDLVAALAGSANFDMRVRHLIALHSASLEECGDHLQVYATFRRLVLPERAEPLRVAWAIYRTRLSQLFEDGQRCGEVRSDLDLSNASRMLNGIHRDLNILYAAKRPDLLQSYADTAVDIFLRGAGRLSVNEPYDRLVTTPDHAINFASSVIR